MKHNILTPAVAVVGLAAAILLVGCATIMGKGAAETLNVRSTPEQATVVITDESGTNIFEGKTPTTLPLEKKKGFFSGKSYSVKISQTGYADQTIIVGTRVNGWYVGGNIIFGGLIGWLILDPATGAMWTLDSNDINVTLAPTKTGSTSGGPAILLLKDVPLTLRDRMVRVAQ